MKMIIFLSYFAASLRLSNAVPDGKKTENMVLNEIQHKHQGIIL